MADAREQQFQKDIIDQLAASGWHVGESSAYERQRALYPEDLLAYYREAHPDQWQRFWRLNPQDPARVLRDDRGGKLGKVGMLEILGEGDNERKIWTLPGPSPLAIPSLDR